VAGYREASTDHRKHFWSSLFYTDCAVFVCNVFRGGYIRRAVKGAKFDGAYYKIPHVFDDKSTSMRVQIFYLGRQFTRYRIDVYIADFLHFFRSRARKHRNMHDVAVFSFVSEYGIGATTMSACERLSTIQTYCHRRANSTVYT